MLTLVIDCALPSCRVALLDTAELIVERVLEAAHGQASLLPGVVAGLLAEHDRPLGRIVVNVGPGSFTGLRVGLSLAHGLALASGARLVGVTGGEALSVTVEAAGRTLWVATPARAGRVFLERDGVASSALLDALPAVEGPVLVAGAAAADVVRRLTARNDDVLLGVCQGPDASALVAAALRRVEGALLPRAALPLYVDAPEASLPRGGLRPVPA